MYDIIIIGTGPAGATLARTLPKNFKILLVDKRNITGSADNFSEKCCGGLLAPDAQAALSQMSLSLPKSVLVDPQIFAVKAIDLQKKITQFYQRFYINMDRRKFDLWMLSLVGPNVSVRFNTHFKSYKKTGKEIQVNFIEQNNSYTEECKILVGADGASSQVRKQTFIRENMPRQYISIQHLVESSSQLPFFCSIFDSQITDYYCWTIPKENNLLIGAALHPFDNPTSRFELLKTKLQSINFHIGKTIRKQSAFILRPLYLNQIHCSQNGVALIGEAAGFISPSSAEGLSFAFKSALVLAEVLAKRTEDFEKEYFCKTVKLRLGIFGKNLKSHLIYNPFIRNTAMSIGYKSLKMFDVDNSRVK